MHGFTALVMAEIMHLALVKAFDPMLKHRRKRRRVRNKTVTELQKGLGWTGPLESSSPTPCSKLRHFVQGLCSLCLQGWRLHSLPGHLFQRLFPWWKL